MPDIGDEQSGQQPIGFAAGALALLLAALWGGTPVAVKFSLDRLPMMAVAGIRFAMAAAFMLLWCRVERSGLRLRFGQVLPALMTGLLLLLQIGLFNLAIDLSNASHSTLLINTFIVWVVAIEHFVMRSVQLDARKVAGLLTAGLGVALILLTTESGGGASGSNAASLWGDLAMVASAVVLGVKIIYTKHAMRTVEPGKLIFWHDVIGVAGFAVWSLCFEQADVRPFLSAALFDDSTIRNATLGLLYQGVVVAGFCFAAQALLLRRHSASQLSVFSFATPLFGVTYAVLLRSEALSSWLAVSGIAVAAGILLVNWPARRRGGGGAP
ncbi:MAG: DMT family transporter [Planctomycetaceae bacterium]